MEEITFLHSLSQLVQQVKTATEDLDVQEKSLSSCVEYFLYLSQVYSLPCVGQLISTRYRGFTAPC